MKGARAAATSCFCSIAATSLQFIGDGRLKVKVGAEGGESGMTWLRCSIAGFQVSPFAIRKSRRDRKVA
jgi:hypothetical protein